MTKNKLILIGLLAAFIFILEFTFFNQLFFEDVNLLYFSKGILKSGFFIGSYVAALISISLLFFIRNKYIFIMSSFIALISYIITTSYRLINGHGFGLNELQVMIHESNKFSIDVWNSYSSLLLKGFGFIVFFLLIAFLIRRFINKNDLHIPTPFVVTSFLFSLGLALIVVFKTVNTNILYPAPINLVSTLIYYVNNAPYRGERENLTEKPTSPAIYKNIIWMVDESIGGKYLSINGYEKETTPFLSSIKDKYINLGIASSTANCSAESNLILMSGIQLSQIPDQDFHALKKANIFQYAKNAGFTTHYISGQSHDDLLQNYMTSFDLESIDDFYQPPTNFKNEIIPEGDIINRIKKTLANGKKNFIYVVKRGAHFHWEGQYPKSKTIFKPALKPSDNLILENKEKALNSYANAVRYKVDDFFKSFYEITDFSNDKSTLIIYTSDHGQSIIEGNSFATHCDGLNPNGTQGDVPLLLFTNVSKNLFKNAQVNKHSNYQIFPTTLDLMGYKTHHGKSILAGPEKEQLFFSGDLFGRTHTQKNAID